MDSNVIIRPKNNGLQVIVSYKYNNEKKWKQKSKQGFENTRDGKKKAKTWANETVNALSEFETSNKDYIGISFGDYSKEYIEHIKLTYANNTIIVYSYAIKHFESLKNIELKELTNLDIQKCCDEMVRKGMSTNSINTYVDKINAILNDAVKNDIIPKNPCKISTKSIKSDKQALTSYELDSLLSTMKNKNYTYYIACLLAGKCGLRRGEILGLTWDNIHNDFIKVEKQWKQKEDKTWGFGDLKTSNSYREVPISQKIYDELKKYKDSLSTINIDNRVFNYITYTALSKNMIKNFKKMGYDITLHELRHTYTTLLIMNDMDLKTVADFIGDDIKEVFKTYSHVTSEMRKKGANIIKNIF